MSENRKLVEETVRANPGIGFQELKERTGLPTGVVQYHVRKSEDLVRRKKAILPKDRCKECVFGGLCRDKCSHKILRKDLDREIIEMLEEGRKQSEIAEELDLDRSTVSYHVKKLRENNLLEGDELTPEVREVLEI
ncbi:MAG: winged helix-turn-helix transcriptional regulator [Candidatus Nanohaloarchaea archaeon]